MSGNKRPAGARDGQSSWLEHLSDTGPILDTPDPGQCRCCQVWHYEGGDLCSSV